MRKITTAVLTAALVLGGSAAALACDSDSEPTPPQPPADVFVYTESALDCTYVLTTFTATYVTEYVLADNAWVQEPVEGVEVTSETTYATLTLAEAVAYEPDFEARCVPPTPAPPVTPEPTPITTVVTPDGYVVPAGELG